MLKRYVFFLVCVWGGACIVDWRLQRKVTSSSLNDAVEHLQQQTKDLQTEMARLEEQCEVYLGKLQK